MLLGTNDFLGNPFKTREDVTKGCVASVALEAFARPLWGLASLLAGGGQYEGTERWIRGLASGTDPKNPEYWGGSMDKDQRMVEMSPLSFAVAMAPDVFYAVNICAFLQTSNWLWFRVFANLALRSVGSHLHNPEQMEKDLQRLEEFQLPPNLASGDDLASSGWSRDGPEDVKQLDYYSSSFAIQPAQMIYAKVGSAIPFGRSMVYRFAAIATASCMALADIEPPAPLTWGHLKGLVLRHIRYWNDAKDIFRSDSTLNVGYRFDCMNMTENYNAPAFLCLAAPNDHPFWSSTELPWPKDYLALTKSLPDPSHIMCRQGGHTFLLSSGQAPHYAMRHGPAKYCKFSYSATFGFCCPTGDMDLGQLAPDSMLALRDASDGVETCDGETWRIRRQPIDAQIVGRGTDKVHLRSKWRPWKGVEVETWLVPPQESVSNWYLRVHKITSDRKLESAEGGWANYGQGADGRALIQSFSGLMSKGGDQEIGWSRAATAGGTVGVMDIPYKGSQGKRQGQLVQIDPNANVIFSRGILPSLVGTLESGETWLVTAVFGKPPGQWEKAWEAVPAVPDWIQ
ncbi:hypothetical protein IAU60_003034 [Kwoniella sp. DSM 27419]